MILDGLEGDPSAACDAADWFLCCGPWKIQLRQDLTSRPLSMQPTDKRSKPLLPNHHNIDLDTSNG
jgi:hypothetical protein